MIVPCCLCLARQRGARGLALQLANPFLGTVLYPLYFLLGRGMHPHHQPPSSSPLSPLIPAVVL